MNVRNLEHARMHARRNTGSMAGGLCTLELCWYYWRQMMLAWRRLGTHDEMFIHMELVVGMAWRVRAVFCA
jgi:hypothetical protein